VHDIDRVQLGLCRAELEDQEVRVVFPRVQLLDYPRNAGLIPPHHNKNVFGIEPQAHEI